MWYNWLLLLELDALDHDGDGQPDNAVIRKYTWGLDLAGLHGQVDSLEAAGGIGGLLAIEDPDDPNHPADPHGSFACFYDANGNLAQLVDLADGSLAARYEYDPYGNLTGPDTNSDGVFDPTTDDAGAYAAENPIRFSTKYFDDETGFGYWGYRYYSPRLGRWLSRDPLGELAAAHAYCYVHNSPALGVDGLADNFWTFASAFQQAPAITTTQPAEPSEDRTRVCCKYTKQCTTTIYYEFKNIRPSTRRKTERFQKTQPCHAGASHPAECCDCQGRLVTDKMHGGTRTVTVLMLDRASWGACCECTVYMVRPKGLRWPMHATTIIVCPDWKIQIDFYPLRVTTFGSRGQKVRVQPPYNGVPPNDYWQVLRSQRTDCETAARLRRRAEQHSVAPPDYNIIQDCYWYGNMMICEGSEGYVPRD